VKTLIDILRISFSMPIVLALIFHVNHGVSLAQGPELGLTIFIVPEKIVCPKGYKSYNKKYYEEVRSNCPKLSITDIEKIKAEYEPVLQIENIPPQEVKLKQEIFSELFLYKSFAGDPNPDNRKSVVFVFEWKIEPPDSTLLLSRITDPKNTDIPDMEWEDKLIGTHYIHHERADALDPGQKIKWKLETGGHLWTFFVTRNPR
jgi:hypothetical protein